MRLNPRQRWHEGKSPISLPGPSWYSHGSTVAGVPAVMLGTMIVLARENAEQDRKAMNVAGGSTPQEARAYHSRIAEFAGWLFDSLKQLDTADGWVEGKFGMVRRGRGEGPDVEITVVSKNYEDMRQFLTAASLGWYDRHPSTWKRPEGEPRVEPTAWMELIKQVIQTLDKSSDRRPFAQYTYRDVAISSVEPWHRKLMVSRRKERIVSERKFSKVLDDMFERTVPRVGRLGALDLKVAKQESV